MNSLLLRCCAALLLIGYGLLWPQSARAGSGSIITCSVTISNFSFGVVNPLSSGSSQVLGTLSYSCTKAGNGAGSAALCFSFSDGSNPPQMTGISNSSHTLQYQLSTGTYYPAGTTWNATSPPTVSFAMAGGSTLQTGSIQLYGQVLNGQTTAAQDNYQDPSAKVTTTVSTNGTGSPPPTCNSSLTQTVLTPVLVTASISTLCTVTANNMDFGSVSPTSTNARTSSTIAITCGSGTPYNVGLAPTSNSLGTGQGLMSGQISGNTDKVPYQLYQDGNYATFWGNTLGTNTLTTTNGLATGTGSAQSYTVYGQVPSTNFTPDNYSDTVTVNVTY